MKDLKGFKCIFIIDVVRSIKGIPLSQRKYI
uniref:Uncharacterized protein n=1 Tax=Rhizophora mucronata TaxID=61149 RepID=A0A2P2J1S8_RHIMU